ncbi:odorant receptor 26 isoform X2 [Nasonia vitripennis]|uniref:Odorant receptor n=1 Tax=Nasonia vitripennis TaxID=7425 RepID=A0A7M7M764_NASVI|nr:odorant receptor 26 isoform X2 [Nasonia vitripennis]
MQYFQASPPLNFFILSIRACAVHCELKGSLHRACIVEELQCSKSARLVYFAMDKKRGFDHTFGMCSINLGIVGLWPNSKNTKFQEFRSNVSFVFAIFSVSVFISMSQTAKLIMIWGDLYQMIENISTANLPITVTVFKMLIFRSHKKVLGELLALAIGDWCTKKTEEETANMCANARLAHRISMICVFLAGGTVSIHAVLRTCQELDIMPGPPEKRLPLFSSSYVPYDYKSSPIYQVTWLMQLTGTSCATLVFSGVYCAFVGMVLHLRGQVANLRLKLENICEIREKGEGLVEARRDFRKKLGFIVERHLVLNRSRNCFYVDVPCRTSVLHYTNLSASFLISDVAFQYKTRLSHFGTIFLDGLYYACRDACLHLLFRC